jgi:5-methylcytosine-specific restriction enzyme A
MTPAVFDNDDMPYLRWMADNPNGYVLNARSDTGSRYLKFHRSGCRHITTYTRSHAEGAFTAHDYLKVCSNEPSTLIEWAVTNRPGGVSYESCKTCTPGIESVTVPLAEEVPAASNFVEGAVRVVSVNAYERNPIARRACLAHHGCSCAVCGFNFGQAFGPIAEGFIHVHHLVPLAAVGRAYEVDPIKDLRPVCPNCHAAIHIGGGARTIEELRETLATRKAVA